MAMRCTTKGSTKASTKNLVGIFYYNEERTEVLMWGKNTAGKKKKNNQKQNPGWLNSSTDHCLWGSPLTFLLSRLISPSSQTPSAFPSFFFHSCRIGIEPKTYMPGMNSI